VKNHYQTLGVPTAASEEQVKAAFKSLAVQLHPDKHQGNLEMEERFKEINEAYQVLSDPYQKAQFDLKLHYQNFSTSQAQRPGYSSPAPAYKHPPGRHRPFVQYDYKGNVKSTLFAFGITFLIALVAMGVSGLHTLYLQNKYEELLVERRGVFDKAQELYSSNIKESLTILADLAPFKTEEEDMKSFRSEKLEEIIFKGETYYLEKDFEQAIAYYELVDRFSPYRPPTMKARLAQSYRFIHKPNQSLRLFAELIEDNYQVIATLVQMGEVYRDELEDFESARDYLELARDAAIRQYRSRFGRAYSVVVTSEFIPVDHFYLFEDLGKLYNEMDEPEKSLGASHWMKRVWPDSASAYAIAGKSHELMGNTTLACGEYQLAIFLGHSDPLPIICK